MLFVRMGCCLVHDRKCIVFDCGLLRSLTTPTGAQGTWDDPNNITKNNNDDEKSVDRRRR